MKEKGTIFGTSTSIAICKRGKAFLNRLEKIGAKQPHSMGNFTLKFDSKVCPKFEKDIKMK